MFDLTHQHSENKVNIKVDIITSNNHYTFIYMYVHMLNLHFMTMHLHILCELIIRPVEVRYCCDTNSCVLFSLSKKKMYDCSMELVVKLDFITPQ